MPDLTTSVLIPSYRRPETLRRCLEALAAQDTLPNEVIVVWQGDDTPTRDRAEQIRGSLPFTFHVLHSPEKGVVVSENRALDAATGQIILLIDDDAIAPPHWIRSHLKHYADPAVGAVGGPADNFYADGGGPRRRAREPVGRLTWYGNVVGNMYDQDESWRARPPRQVDHLVGYNLSLRRSAFDRFEQALRPYWNLFELDACLQVAAHGFRVLFDFALVVEHHPTNTAYSGGRDGDLALKVVNPSYNQAYILSRWSRPWLRPWRLLYLLLGGYPQRPGLLLVPLAVWRFGRPGRELRLLGQNLRAMLQGWRDGARHRVTR